MTNPQVAAEQKTFSRVVSLVAKGLKADGFVRRGRAFNRRVSSGVVHALAFQKFRDFPASYDSVIPGATGINGRFCINFDVVVPEVYSAMHDGAAVPDFVQPFGLFLGGRFGGDVWPDERNSLARPAEEIAKDVWTVYEREGVPLSEECSSAKGIVGHFERGGILRRNNGHLAREAYGYCFAAIGESGRAASVLQSLVDAAVAEHGRTSYDERIAHAAERLGIGLRW